MSKQPTFAPPHRVLPFQILHVPKSPPPPRYAEQCCAVWREKVDLVSMHFLEAFGFLLLLLGEFWMLAVVS